jgi:hypothetical protein
MIFKLLAALTLMLAFVQAPAGTGSQAPGPATVHPATPSTPAAGSKPRTPASVSPRQQEPAVNSTTPQPAEPAPNPSAAPPCPGGNCDEFPTSVKVANPPPVPPLWSLHDRILWASLIILVVLGYVGILLAVSTLKKIERNTRSGEAAAAAAYDSARAALLHAEIIMKAERPWILVSIEPSPGIANGFTITAANRGRTPARLVAIPHKIEFAEEESSLPDVPEYQDLTTGTPFAPIILLPGEITQIATFCRDDVQGLCTSEEQFARVENWEERIFLYGRVTYRDLLSPQDEQIHQTAWCFWYIHGHQNSGMVPSGSRNYNLHT